jgi:SagB-type dehydrogenase family enzyme
MMMMVNQDVEAARKFHEGTKHPHGNLMDPAHTYHPGLEPLKFKVYEGVERTALPLKSEPLGMAALEAIRPDTQRRYQETTPSVDTLSQILYYSAGVTKKIEYPWGDYFFRAAACTGALYHIELYVVCGDLPELAAGIYHYEPQVHELAKLRGGDYRRELVEAGADEASLMHAPIVLIFTDVFWRNAVNYQARAYRHTYWDGGAILSQTLAVCAAKALPARLVVGFDDDRVNALLSLDVEQEASFALVSVGNAPTMNAAVPPPITPLDYTVMPLGGRTPRKFTAIQTIHAASSFHNKEQVSEWRIATPDLPAPQNPPIALQPLEGEFCPTDDLGTVILRRGSTRQFVREPISFGQLSTILVSSMRGVSADFLEPYRSSLVTPYLIVNAVDGLDAGTYVYHREGLERLKAGEFREVAGELALGQALAADASVNVYFLTQLDRVLRAYGNRGYRAAQLEAAIEAGRMYIAAYAQHIGATGLTFFDDEVTEFFSPHAEGKRVMFLIAIGKKARRSHQP